MPHGHCYLWRADILWTHVLSDAAIAMSYFLIPIIMAILINKRKKNIPYPDIFGLFIAFIFFCGLTHLVSIYVVWNPIYEHQGWLKALTAFISMLTVMVLIPKLPLLIGLPGVEEAYRKSQLDLHSLQQKYEQMSQIFTATLNREDRIVELKKEVNQLLVEQGKEPIYNLNGPGY